MKLIFTIILSVTMSVTFSQKYDTVEHNKGQVDGFLRIRELTADGQIRKVWSTFWIQDQYYRKSFAQYNSSDQLVTRVDSTFTNLNILVSIERNIGNTTDGDKQEYDESGRLISRIIYLNINNAFRVYRRYINYGVWYYGTLVDGKYVAISQEKFEEAVRIYNNRLERHRQQNK